MKCSKCGNELNFLSGSPYLNRFGGYVKKNYAKCENCGEYFESPEIKVAKKQSALGIVALILSISVVFSVFGFILGLIDVIKDNKTKKHTCSIIAMALTSIFLFASFIMSNGEKNESNQEQATQKVEQESNVEKQKEPKKEISVNEELIFDKNDVKIYVKSIEEAPTEYALNLQIENNSSLNLGFNAHAYAINKVMTNNNIYDMDYDVAASKKTTAQLKIKKSLMEKLEIDTLKTIDLLIWAYDNDKMFKEFDTGQISIKTNFDDGKNKVLKGDNVYEKDGIKIDFINSENDEYTFCIKNDTGIYFDFDVENVTINDCTSSDLDFDLMSIITLNECTALFTIEPNEDFMNLNSIESIDKIEFNLDIKPSENHFDSYKTEVIKLNVN